MGIVNLYNAPHMLNQKTGDECNLPEPSIAVSHDASPILILAQGDSEILVNPESVDDLCKLLKKIKQAAIEFKPE